MASLSPVEMLCASPPQFAQSFAGEGFSARRLEVRVVFALEAGGQRYGFPVTEPEKWRAAFQIATTEHASEWAFRLAITCKLAVGTELVGAFLAANMEGHARRAGLRGAGAYRHPLGPLGILAVSPEVELWVCASEDDRQRQGFALHEIKGDFSAEAVSLALRKALAIQKRWARQGFHYDPGGFYKQLALSQQRAAGILARATEVIGEAAGPEDTWLI